MLFTQRLPRILLWVVLFVFPALYCVSFIVGDFITTYGLFTSESDIYIAGQAININTPAVEDNPTPWFHYLGFLIAGIFRLWPLWLAFVLCAIVLLVAAFVMRTLGKLPFIRNPSSTKQLAGQLFILLSLAYVMGSLIHIASSPWLSEFPYRPLPPDYWWPYYGWPVEDSGAQGWTIYPPLSSLPMFPWTQAACFKLGALLALLVARHLWLRRNRVLQQHS